MEATWIFISAIIPGLLGLGHLLLTYFGPKLLPRDLSLRDAMEQVSPVITTQTTIWRAWLGFNVSHSMGLLLFGLFYGYLALAHSDLLFQSVFLQLVGGCILVGYVVLAKLYWFSSPLIGTSLALIFYLVGVGLG
jgi:hypothetical protein